MMQATDDLHGARILIVEDDYYLAIDMRDVLEDAGAVIIGPFPDETEAVSSLENDRPDCAFVDVNLGDGPSFQVPRRLADLSIPFAFVTGYDAETIPAEFDAVERLEKPVDAGRIAVVAFRLIAAGAARPN